MDNDKISKAKEIATKYHKGQFRKYNNKINIKWKELKGFLESEFLIEISGKYKDIYRWTTAFKKLIEEPGEKKKYE